jgi:hypothetical protein
LDAARPSLEPFDRTVSRNLLLIERLIMRTHMSSLLALLAIGGLGCQSSTNPAPQAMSSAQRAVIVTGGNGGSTTVFLPSGDPANPVMLSASGGAVCPECKAAAIKYFQTGVLDPKCARTGATRTAAMGIPPIYGHN